MTAPDDGARLGPVEVIALAFPAGDVPDDVLREVVRLAGSDHVRVVDVVLVRATDDGFDLLEVDDEDGALALLAGEIGVLVAGGLAAEQDLDLVASRLPSGASALVLVVEHTWARGLAAAARAAGAHVLLTEHVPAEVVHAVATA